MGHPRAPTARLGEDRQARRQRRPARQRAWLGRGEARQTSAAGEVYSFGGKTFDFGALELKARGRVVRLTLMEAELLRYLVAKAGRAVSRREILEEVWNLHEDTDTRAIDNFIVRLRRHVEDDTSDPRTF